LIRDFNYNGRDGVLLKQLHSSRGDRQCDMVVQSLYGAELPRFAASLDTWTDPLLLLLLLLLLLVVVVGQRRHVQIQRLLLSQISSRCALPLEYCRKPITKQSPDGLLSTALQTKSACATALDAALLLSIYLQLWMRVKHSPSWITWNSRRRRDALARSARLSYEWICSCFSSCPAEVLVVLSMGCFALPRKMP